MHPLEKIADLFTLFGLEFLVHSTALHCLVEIDKMTVEVGTVDASKFCLAANCKTAAAAHSRTVDHNRVHRNYGFYIVLLGKLAHKLHHDQWTDSDDFIILVPRFDKLLERVGNEPLSAVRAVVRHYLHNVGNRIEFVFEDNEIFVSETNDGMYLAAVVMQLLCYRIRDSAANAAAYDSDLFKPLGMRCNAERTYEIVNILALVKVVKQLGRRADDLDRKSVV